MLIALRLNLAVFGLDSKGPTLSRAQCPFGDAVELSTAMPTAHSALIVAILAILLTACGPSSQPPDLNSRPSAPTQLSAVSANLDLSGAIRGHISQARLSQCSSRKDGSFTSFYASVYFQHQEQWYYVQLIGLNPLPVKGGTSPTGYSGPGRYQAEIDFRDMTLQPGHMINGEHAWGVPLDRMGSITVSQDGPTITLGTFSGSAFQPVMSDHADLWPQRPDQTGPPPSPVPSPDEIVTLRGSWSCR